MSELRWHPFLETWVITATHRQERTFLPPADYCPFCPTRPGSLPTEVPSEDYGIVVLQNRFPSLQPVPPAPAAQSAELYTVQPSQGVCEVVLYTPHHEGSLGDRSQREIERLIHVWTDRYEELGSLPYVDYVFIFENKGEAVGVTLSHPHGQIYAFPYIPPIVQQELAASARHLQHTGRCLLCDVLEQERTDGRRIVIESDDFLAFIPWYARYPYEVHVTSKAHRGALSDLSASEKRDLARILKRLLETYDALWGFPLPYIMVMHQRPSDGGKHEGCHFHIEFYPPHRTRDKLKYLAGCESGAGTFINDTLPEETAAELRRIDETRQSGQSGA